MTDLKWLYDTIEGRMKHDLARIHWQNIAQDAGDEIAAVLRAAEIAVNEAIRLGNDRMPRHPIILARETELLMRALAALAAKGGGK